MLRGVNSRLEELQTVLDQSLNLRKSLLLNASSNINTWFCKIKKMKAIYHTMNMFKYDQKSVIAECWIPANEADRIRDVLDTETVSKFFCFCFFGLPFLLIIIFFYFEQNLEKN